MSDTVDDRYVRQRGLVPPAALAGTFAFVVGVGAVGHALARNLASMGVPALTLVDPDVVGVENLSPQMFTEEDLGRAKVDVVAEECRRFYPAEGRESRVFTYPDHWHVSRYPVEAEYQDPRMAGKRVAVFSCVDGPPGETRARLWHDVRTRAAFWCDARMSGESINILASGHPSSDERYERTLYSRAETYEGPCTGRSTAYAATIAAGLMAQQFVLWLRWVPVDKDLLWNIAAGEVSTPEV
jgi:hypothetical protein